MTRFRYTSKLQPKYFCSKVKKNCIFGYCYKDTHLMFLITLQYTYVNTVKHNYARMITGMQHAENFELRK